MKALWNKYWPSIVHVIAVGILAGDSHVRNFAMAHIAWSGPILLGWGLLLHWATSPKHVTTPK
jgi:hypothetical protein